MGCFICKKPTGDPQAVICADCWAKTKGLSPDVMFVQFPDGSTNQPSKEE